ncbi:MAG TPA: hypothetical protein VIT23_17755, partial [Terrimicrobiaceae bacterium]
RATMIARRIVDELQSLPATNTALVRGPSVTNSAWRITGLDLSTASTNILLYDDQAEGLTNQIAPESFPSSISAPKALFAAEVRVTPNYPWPGISRVQAKIETPSDAPSSKRSSFLFVTFMNPRQ